MSIATDNKVRDLERIVTDLQARVRVLELGRQTQAVGFKQPILHAPKDAKWKTEPSVR